jgi:arylformamidase
MKIIDITQEILSCKVFPGDPAPEGKRILSMEKGDYCNCSTLFMCAHNGTHVDAPFHFINDGKTIDKLPLDVFVGYAYVYRHDGIVTKNDALSIMQQAKGLNASERILIAGKATVSEEAASVFAEAKVKLVGNESQTVGPEDGPIPVHKILLGAGISLLEGVKLDDVTTVNIS